jgi:hypothetical protein
MNAKTAVAHPTSVDGSGVESKVMPVMPTKPLKLGAASADTVYTLPLFAPLIGMISAGDRNVRCKKVSRKS